jgi:hypothetical protein
MKGNKAADMPPWSTSHQLDWRTARRFVVWLLFMISGVVVIPLSVAMCIAYFPGGLPVLLGWLDWAESVHSWMLGRTSFLGAPLDLPAGTTQDPGEQVQDGRRSRVCPVCDFECVAETGAVNQCPNCTHLFDISRAMVQRSGSCVLNESVLSYPSW